MRELHTPFISACASCCVCILLLLLSVCLGTHVCTCMYTIGIWVVCVHMYTVPFIAHVVMELPTYIQLYMCSHTRMHLNFSEPFEVKLETLCPLTPKHHKYCEYLLGKGHSSRTPALLPKPGDFILTLSHLTYSLYPDSVTCPHSVLPSRPPLPPRTPPASRGRSAGLEG